jgi:membrane-associated phospholipid phosphatase
MRTSELVNLLYFFLFTVFAFVWALPSRSRIKAVWIGAAGVGLTVTASAADGWLTPYAAGVLRDWLPTFLMPLAYWQSGCFFQKANPKLQAVFENLERRILQGLRVDLAGWARTWLGGLLELAYVFCYPVVPLGLATLYLSGLGNAADEYWSVVLLAAYPCYVLLPFIQLLPPRLVEGTDASTNRSPQVRRFNLWLIRRVTHEANTFPSGHVAASTAIALVLLHFSPAEGTIFALIAVGIAAGCIVGRYHYIVDVGAAFGLAVTIFAIIVL